MSKAFTRESDDLPDQPVLPRQSSALPSGAKNYLTPDGARRLREELERLVQTERPAVAASPDGDDTRRQLQVLDQRILHLQQSLQSAVVVTPPSAPEDRVRFGATVAVRERNGSESRYRIVGVDETDIDRGWVSWLSPIARALLNARLGQRVRFKFPSGENELEIVAITYE
jgi:transcription elongation factor GreB